MFLVLSKFNGNQKHLIFKETFCVDPEQISFGVIFFSLSTETDASLLLQLTGSAMYSLISVGTKSDLLTIMRILLFTHSQKTESMSLFLVSPCSLWYVYNFVKIWKVLNLLTHWFSEEGASQKKKLKFWEILKAGFNIWEWIKLIVP